MILQFSINLNTGAPNQGKGLLSDVWRAIRPCVQLLMVSSQLSVNVNESEYAVYVSPTHSGKPNVEKKEKVIKGWITPFGCWLATNNTACFIAKQDLQEAEFRCLCRVLIWH